MLSASLSAAYRNGYVTVSVQHQAEQADAGALGADEEDGGLSGRGKRSGDALSLLNTVDAGVPIRAALLFTAKVYYN